MPTTPNAADLQHEDTWLEYRSLAFADAPAMKVSELVTSDQYRAEFLEGARLLRLWDRRRSDGGSGPSPIQIAIADMLNAHTFRNAILEPRRTTKTTSVQAVMLGRCTLRDDYLIGWTMATTGAKAGERFRKDIVVHLERLYPTKSARPFGINVGKGTEHIEWPNGSFLNVYAPKGEGFRSGGFDFAFVDEGGEADVEMSEDLTLAVLPTMDTRPDAQFVVAGTGAKFRTGNLLWDYLNKPGAAVIAHGLDEATPRDQFEQWDDLDDGRPGMRELIRGAHPGVGWTTDLSAIERNYEDFPLDKFLAEYGGIFGEEGAGTGVIPAPLWEAAALDDPMPKPPARFSLAIAVHPDGLWASIGVAWEHQEPVDLATQAWGLDGREPEDTRKRTAIGLLWHQKGVNGFAAKVLAYARKYRVPVIYDPLSQSAAVEVRMFARAAPRPKMTEAKTVDVRQGATKLLNSLTLGTLVHYRQNAPLQEAVTKAVKRQIGAMGWGFGRPKDDPDADITPLEACSLALQFLEDQPTAVAPSQAMDFGKPKPAEPTPAVDPAPKPKRAASPADALRF